MGFTDMIGGMNKKKLAGTALSIFGSGMILLAGFEDEQETRKRHDKICEEYSYKAGQDCWKAKNAGQKMNKKKSKAERKQ